MRKLTIGELNAIKEEAKKQSLDDAIKFCLGYDKLKNWTKDAQRTVEAVRAQL